MFKLNIEYVMERVRSYAEELVSKRIAETVILFGSLAKGTYSPFSDIDVLILVEDASPNPLDRISKYIDPKLPLDIEPRVLTINEFFNIIKEERRFGREILENGIVLAGKREILEEARKLYSTIKNK
ncbi:MAG: nucleotidyltransferase domain-containing protein [Thaumarchaeota archaeon]|nr:nucleotidyltransferase domain-containing protein [Candidatus Geocrenenecus arthurdayi]MCL7391913.1 nucleotidyltransferase domain-containing protein [Candidatus Geocrenenecus arthurdayi]MCL7404311.1 nucleotidyltransferase domain-containing protein [Candidatus Geocrenenecus arthurdayi]